MNLDIIPLTHISYQDWQPLWQSYQKFYHVALSEAVCQNTWQKLSDPQSPHIYGFAARLDGKIVGIVHVIEHDSCWSIQPYAYLQDLFTLEQYRGLGIARQLIEAVKDATQIRQCDRVYWLTHQENAIAQQLYDQIARKTGFIQYRL